MARAVSRRVGVLVLLLAGSAGCSSTFPVEEPVGDALDVVIIDERVDAERVYPMFQVGLTFWPLVPYITQSTNPHLDRTLAPEMRDIIKRSGMFGSVTIPGDDPVRRRKAQLELRITLRETHDGYMSTSYLMGFAGQLMWLVGIPESYSYTRVHLELEWVRRGDEPETLLKSEASNSELGVYWVYENNGGTEAEERLEDTLELALEEGLAEALEAFE